MIKKVKYKTEQERELIIKDNQNLLLLEEQNIIEGNFLIFADMIPDLPVVSEPVDDEKAYMAETIINLEAELQKLKGV